MSDQEDRNDLDPPPGPGPTPDDIHQEPPGNPETDQDAVDKGRDQLDRVKPY